MFGWEGELLVVLIVALVVVGPKDLPRLLRMVGKWVGRARAMADQFKASFDEMARESELDELRKELAALRDHNPLAKLNDEIHNSILPPAATPSAKAMLGEVEPAAPPHDIHAEPEPEPSPNHAEPLPPGFTPAGP